MTPQVVPCDHVGVEIHGIDLANLSQEEFALTWEHFLQHGVVFFRGQSLTPEEHLCFARRFGPITVNRFFTAVGDHPQIAQVLKDKHEKTNIGEGFHTDHSYDIEPALGSILLARELPDHGGDTLFVDMRRAYETLPVKMRCRLDNMNAVHTNMHVFGASNLQKLVGRLGNSAAAAHVAVHPVVITHPDSGHKVLYINPAFTLHFEGMTVAESQPLLEELYYHSVRPEHLHRFRWELGSVAVWDNRAMWHCAMNDYHGQRRLMHRVTIGGVKLSGLKDPGSLTTLHLASDADKARYDPGDRMNVELRQRALGQKGTPVSKL